MKFKILSIDCSSRIQKMMLNTTKLIRLIPKMNIHPLM